MRCGTIGLIGKPNVGKSTLLNKLLGRKVSITSRKAQTTRHRILGIKTLKDIQFVYTDTPGLHSGKDFALNRYLNKVAKNVIGDVDVIVWLLNGMEWAEQDKEIASILAGVKKPIIIAINKVDRIKDKRLLLPYLDVLEKVLAVEAIVPLSAKTGDQLPILEACIGKHLSVSPYYFPSDQVMDRDESFLISELIREKLINAVGMELPHALTVTLERCEKIANVLHVMGIVYVERVSQRPIILGEKGKRLKAVCIKARQDIEREVRSKVYLRLLVKVQKNWTHELSQLQKFGYE